MLNIDVEGRISSASSSSMGTLHQLHRHPRGEHPRDRHREVRGCPWRRDRPEQRRRRLSACVRVLPRPRGRSVQLLKKVGEEVEGLIVNVDRKTRGINLSIRAKDQVEQSEAMSKLASDSASAASSTITSVRC